MKPRRLTTLLASWRKLKWGPEFELATTFKFGDCELDVSAYELRRLGRRVKLERLPMDLLILLVERHGDLVTREEIVERLWGKESFHDAESGVNTAVRKIRQALKDSTDRPTFIQTISGKGYRFSGSVVSGHPAEANRSAALEPQTSVQPGVLPGLVPPASFEDGGRAADADQVAVALPADRELRGAIWRRKLTLSAIVVAGSLLLLAIYVSRGFLPFHSPPPVTLALLPFENLTGNADQEYFADGLSEETIAVLGKLNPNRMMVIARTSTMAYKRRTKTARQIGEELGADYLVEGSVRREGERVRITVKLIRVRDQSRIWSENYDRFGSGVIQIQDELGNAIAREIQVELLPGDTNQRKQTRMLDAYDPYLLGRHFWNQITPGAIRKSIEYFETAIAKDPSYALAFAGLADAYTILPITSDAPPSDMWPLARNAASEAIRLNDRLSEAQAAGGYVDFWLEWDWRRSAERLRRAIELNPNNTSAHRYYAHLLSNSGRHAEAVAQITKARRLDPMSPITNAMAGQFLFYAGRYTAATEALDKAFSIDPGFWVAHVMMGQIYERTGKPEAAIQSFEKAYGSSGGSTVALSMKGYVLARSGRRAEAEQIVHRLIETGKSRFVPPYKIALVYAGLGSRESALQWLEKAYEARDVALVFLAVDPKWDDLRSEPRFQELLKRCHFVIPQ
jgi:TolB-like protein/DNA-binding winged helix-turn-helix (wHTH) protein/Tfp pilus assembly protein PilF